MIKRLEVPIVIALSTLTVLSAGIAIHDMNAHPESFGTTLKHGLEHIGKWVGVQTKPMYMSQLSNVSPTASVSTSSPLSAPLAPYTAGGVGWSTSDVTQFEGIVSDLIKGLTPGDWSVLQKALSADSPSQAEHVIVPVLMSHISPKNQSWLANHFKGPQAFDLEDVQLLQQTFRQIEGELTTSEQGMIQQRLAQLLSTVSPGSTQ